MICSYDNDEDYDDDDEIDYGDDEDQNYYDYDDNTGLERRAGVGREPARGDVYHYPCHCLCTQVFSKVSFNVILYPTPRIPYSYYYYYYYSYVTKSVKY